MTDLHHRGEHASQRDRESWSLEDAMLDRELDAALAKCAAAPRTGLEDRILANVRVAPHRATERSWRRWPALVALAAVIVLAVVIAQRPKKPALTIAVEHLPAPTQTNGQGVTPVANDRANGPRRPHEGSRSHKSQAGRNIAAVVALPPKLAQFPSPQPLSEQEKIMTSYVAQFHDQATLVARARMETLRIEQTEEANQPSMDPGAEN